MGLVSVPFVVDLTFSFCPPSDTLGVSDFNLHLTAPPASGHFSLEWPAVLVNLSALDRAPSRDEVIDLVVYSSYSDNQDYEPEQREISELGGQEPTP